MESPYLMVLAWAFPVISAGLAASLLGLAAGWVGQFAKAHPNIPTPLVQGALMFVGLACYALAFPPTATDAAWLENGIMWVFGPAGVASASGSFKVAPPTSK